MSCEFEILDESSLTSNISFRISCVLEEDSRGAVPNFVENQKFYVFQVRRQNKSNLNFLGVDGGHRSYTMVFQLIEELDLW